MWLSSELRPLAQNNLRVAAAVGDEEAVRLLLEEKADPNATDAVNGGRLMRRESVQCGTTALHLALACKREGAARAMLELGASPLAADEVAR